MDDYERCPQCATLLRDTDTVCPRCGFRLTDDAMIENSIEAATEKAPIEEAQAPIVHPRTIEELKLYTVQKGMPLEKMRFFIGEDYKEPRAFGIYRQDDRFIVYKNKANGERSLRYHGPDEAYAVNELFQKLLSECHKRGIYPDGSEPPAVNSRKAAKYKNKDAFAGATMITICLIIALAIVIGIVINRKNGYYEKDGRLYYRDTFTWYYFDDYLDDWYVYTYPFDDADEYFLSRSYADDYGASEITDSSVWDEQHSSDSYDSDYDSWYSSDTDWDSDW